MALIAAESLERLKQSADIVEVVSAHTDLRRQGARWVGLCPFHDERTPSFSVTRPGSDMGIRFAGRLDASTGRTPRYMPRYFSIGTAFQKTPSRNALSSLRSKKTALCQRPHGAWRHAGPSAKMTAICANISFMRSDFPRCS